MCLKQYSKKDDMHLIIFYCLIAFFFLLQPSFGCKANKQETLTIATFNIAWLGDGKEPETIKRTSDDLVRIADIIQEMQSDIIALQEIENDEAIKLILQHLPDYSAFIGKKGRSQNVGFLYKTSLSIEDLGEYTPLAIDPTRNRPGYVVQIKKGNYDCLLMSVHFKSTSRYDSTEELRVESRNMRMEQSIKALSWMDSIIQLGNEQDLFIIGDFNDFPKRKKDQTLQALTESNIGVFLTSELKSCKFQNLYAIDHIYASSSAKMRYVAGSERMIDIHSMYSKDIAEKVSDHCPVIMQFDISQPDND
jgi:endonuclease/exonuclease/phosphatase family metal-dependent hydrolase